MFPFRETDDERSNHSVVPFESRHNHLQRMGSPNILRCGVDGSADLFKACSKSAQPHAKKFRGVVPHHHHGHRARPTATFGKHAISQNLRDPLVRWRRSNEGQSGVRQRSNTVSVAESTFLFENASNSTPSVVTIRSVSITLLSADMRVTIWVIQVLRGVARFPQMLAGRSKDRPLHGPAKAGPHDGWAG